MIQLRLARVGAKGVEVDQHQAACASNLAQLTVAGLLFLGPGVWFITPPFLLVGLVTSIILGVMAQRFTIQSRWVKKHSRDLPDVGDRRGNHEAHEEYEGGRKKKKGKEKEKE